MKIILGVFFMLAGTQLRAQDSLPAAKKPLLSGYADVYYKYNFNENATDNKTSFTHAQNSFEPGMISLKIQHAVGKVSFLGEVGFGKRAGAFSYHDKNTSIAVEQMYMSYAPLGRIKFSIGSFATHVGYELADANMNRNYSMSYMFSYGPFFHTGIKADFTAGAHTIMIGVFNPTDYKYAPPDSKKFIGGQWGFSPPGSGFHSYLNYIGGKDREGVRNDQLDLVMTWTVNDRFSLDYDGTYSHYERPDSAGADWWGSAWYFNMDFTGTFGLTLRTEYFSDKDNLNVFTDAAAFPQGGSIWSFTLSGNYKLKALTLIPELRLDHAPEALFTRRGKAVKNSCSVLIAAVYSF